MRNSSTIKQFLSTSAALTIILALQVFSSAQDSNVNFTRDIRPILSNKCFACHGPDAAKREGGFRLDIKESAFGEADSGERPIVAGDVQASELVRRIHADDSDQMPPKNAEHQLTDEETELLSEWIKNGADWEEHWAFIPPNRPKLPQVIHDTWPKNAIDHFVLARLESLKLTSQPPADKVTLVRRLYLDLIGLPPTPKQVEEFVLDRSEDAYERLVDRLLESPQFGEHFATMWLDAARFADTNGYQNDFQRTMWPWRDWVINAFNNNMPFDQFTIEQIAGDMLPNASRDQIVATGFNRNHRTNTEGGSIDEEWLVENVVDRVETTSTVFLGLTMGCARCHDHKYDPITQHEFYQFFAYFNNIAEKGVYTEQRGNVEPLINVPSSDHEQQIVILDEKIAAAEEQLALLMKNSKPEREALEKQLSESQTIAFGEGKHLVSLFDVDRPTKPESIETVIDDAIESKKVTVEEQPIGTALVIPTGDDKHLDLGNVFDFDGEKAFCCSVWVKPQQYGAIISRMDEADAYRGFDMLIMPDGRMNVHLIHDWPGNGIKVTTNRRIPKNLWTQVIVSYDGSSKAAGLQIYFNNQPTKFEVNADTLNGTTLTEHPFWIGRRAQTPSFAGAISDLKIYDVAAPVDSTDFGFAATLTHFIKSARENPTEQTQAELDYLFCSNSLDGYLEAVEEIENLKRDREQLENAAPTVMVMRELEEPRATYVLARGQYDQPQLEQQVFPATPNFLPKLDESFPANRLGLAKWLVDPHNPLTARVTVNRFWRNFFGSGLAATPEDFGVQSSLPSHPQLLDWLAIEFIESGWDIKQFCRLIVNSSTYQQSSNASPEEFAADPENRWLARGARFRLSAEMIRDNALMISGLINLKIGGPSIKPYQPEGVWSDLAGGAGEGPYVQETDESLYRRSLYIYRKRTVPHPTMSTFDASSREVCIVARGRTNTPLQALALLNDTTYVEAARNLAQNTMNSASDSVTRIETMFVRATARKPTANELEILGTALARYLERFSDDIESAKQLIALGQSPLDNKLESVELAAYTTLASVILNLDETITRE